jgi:DNA (cytosine-5)-methyltransferase 1
MPKQIPIVSLFCGCGGMDSGLKLQGFIPIIAIDNSEIAIKTYNENNMPHVAVKSDISKLSGEKIISMIDGLGNGIKPRGIVGGPPCQSFSISNVHHNPKDPRNFLPLKFASILKVVNTKYQLDFFIFENVVGLNSKKHANIFASMKTAFTDARFNLFIGELNAKYFGVAQSRKRLFVVGINKDLYPNIEFKFPKGYKGRVYTVRDVIGSLPEPIFFSRSLSAGDIPFHQNHWTMNPKSQKFSNNLAAENSSNGRSFRKLDWDKPSNTLAFGHREINVHPNGHRRISIFEAMRIQGFPDSYKIAGNLTQQVYQVSDALPPNVASAIGESIRKAIYLPQIRISKILIKWYKENHRDYPWRNTNDPYSILIAEKLLQQTSVNENVIKVYNRILSNYPNIRSLSYAESGDLIPIMKKLELISLWSRSSIFWGMTLQRR